MLRPRSAQGADPTLGPSSWRRVRLDRVQALFAAWRRWDGVVAPEAAALERALLTALARDRERYSDIFEASFALDARGPHTYRFSYAFPGWRAEPAAAAATALACAAPFGDNVVAATRRLLRAATAPAVEQPLIGIAWDRGPAPRHKLYLQFRAGAAGAAWALAEQVLARPGLAARYGEADLHMLGVDFGADGALTGAKLYVLHTNMQVDLGEGAPRSLRHVLAIHRCDAASARAPTAVPAPAHAAPEVGSRSREKNGDGYGRPMTMIQSEPPAAEIDFGLADNHLTWAELAATPRIAGLLAGAPPFGALFDAFCLGVRRLSLATDTSRKISVYYGLREVEEP